MISVFVCLVFEYLTDHSRPENLRKSRQKKLVKSIYFSCNCISDGYKLFPSSKIDFWSFLKLQKMEFGQKNFVKLIYLISRVFFAWTFLNFLARCVRSGMKTWFQVIWWTFFLPYQFFRPVVHSVCIVQLRKKVYNFR